MRISSVNSRSAFWFLSLFALFSVLSLFFVQFPAPVRSAIFFAELRCRTFRIFHRNFVMPEADVTSSPGHSLSSSANERMLAPKGYSEIYTKNLTSELNKLISHYYSFRFVTACLALQSHQIQKALVSRLETLQSALLKKKKNFSLITQSKLKFLFLKLGPCAAR